MSKSYTLCDCMLTAQNKGGACLSKRYRNSTSKLRWECELGHRWRATFDHVRRGTWCPTCARTNITLQVCIDYVAAKSGRCLSKRYINNKAKMRWECWKGHRFHSRFCDIKQGHWCNKCSASKAQRQLLGIVRELFKGHRVSNNYRGFDWLKTKNGKQEIDIFVHRLKLAIEYDGEQHFKPVCFGGISKVKALERLKETKRLDRIKTRKIKAHTKDVCYFIRFTYKERITKAYVRSKLLTLGIKIRSSNV